MAKLISTIVNRVNFATKKGLTGYHTPAQICDELHAESMNVWKNYLDQYEKNQIMDVYLRPFQNQETVNLTAGAGTVVTKDFIYYFEGVSVSGPNIEIKDIDNKRYLYRISHPVKIPTAKYPVLSMTNQSVVVTPANAFSSIIVSYLKLPTKPVYAVDTVGDRYIYNDANSIDFEWNAALADKIIDRALAALGVNMRASEMIQYSNQQRALDDQK